jgi:hypothetical protein
MSVLVPPPLPAPIAYRSRWAFPVPWDRADDLRLRLSKRGYPATVCLNPEDRTARLEPWPGVSTHLFAAALGEYLAQPTRRHIQYQY